MSDQEHSQANQVSVEAEARFEANPTALHQMQHHLADIINEKAHEAQESAQA